MKLSNSLYKGLGYRFNRYPFSLIFSMLILLCLLIYLLLPIQIISLSVDESTLFNVTIDIGEEFYIDYTHSVMKTTVRDVFEITENNTLRLTRTEYSSFGAGLPTENYGSFKLENGRYINEGINMELSYIPLRVGNIANHRLLLQEGNEFFLTNFVEGGTLIDVKPRKITRLQNILSKRRNRNV